MPSFQLPNTTPVPNEIINGWAMKLKGSELKVLLLVVRKTLGWILDPKTGLRKEEDWISYSQLKNMTGLSSRPLSNAIDTLCSKYTLIEIRDKDGNKLDTIEKRKIAGRKRLSFFYRLNFGTLSKTSHYFTNESSATLQSKTATTLQSKDYKIKYITKSNITKDNTKVLQKESAVYGNPEINASISYLKEKLALPMLDGSEKENRRYCWLAMRKFGGADKLRVLIEIASRDPFWKAKVTSFRHLYYNGVQIISKTREEKNDRPNIVAIDPA